MGRYSVKRYKTKRYTRDLDQILHDDLKNDTTINKLQSQDFDEYRPGLAQFYCVPCAHYYETQHALDSHKKTKVHKRRVKGLKNPYTKEEADFAAGKDIAKYLALMEKREIHHQTPAVKEVLKLRQELQNVNATAEMEVQVAQADVEQQDQPEIDI